MPDPASPTDLAALKALEGRWTLPLLVLISRGSKRFSDLKAATPGISANLLTVRLRALEESGLVRRGYLAPPAARTVYELGPRGDTLRTVLSALEIWCKVELEASAVLAVGFPTGRTA